MGMAKTKKAPGGTVKKTKNRIAPPMAINTNCFSVKGPIIFSSVSMNWGT